MQDWRKRIVSNKAVLNGRPTIQGTRVSVEFILSLLSSGWTLEQILEEMPQLTSEDVWAAMSCATDVLRLLIERDLHKKFIPVVDDPLKRS